MEMDLQLNSQHGSLPRCKPEEQLVDSSSILQFMSRIDEDELELHSFMMLRNGHVIAEGSWSPYDAKQVHLLNSLSKSFTSTAVGLAVEEGLLTVDDPVIKFFPDEVTPAIQENMKELTVHHLLSMSTGHAVDTMPYLHGQENWVKAFLEVPIEHKPGTHFLYNTGASYMLSAILHKVSGQSLLNFLQPRLFDTLNITGVRSLSCPRGIHAGGFGMFMKVEDIAKLGLLYLQEGMWNGKQVLSKQWVNTAVQKHISNGNDAKSDWAQGYGYQFWRCRHGAYRGDGAFGQFCIVLPDKNTVIAITAGAMEMQTVLDHVWETLLPGIKTDDLEHRLAHKQAVDDAAPSSAAAAVDRLAGADASAQEKLAAKLSSLAYRAKSNERATLAYDNWNGKLFKFSGADIESIRFQFSEDQCSMLIKDQLEAQVLTIGIGAWTDNELRLGLGQSKNKICASGGWIKKNKFQIQLRFLEQAYVDTWTCHFVNDSVKISNERNVWIVPGLSDDALLPTLVGYVYEDRDMWIGNGAGKRE